MRIISVFFIFCYCSNNCKLNKSTKCTTEHSKSDKQKPSIDISPPFRRNIVSFNEEKKHNRTLSILHRRHHVFWIITLGMLILLLHTFCSPLVYFPIIFHSKSANETRKSQSNCLLHTKFVSIFHLSGIWLKM